MKITVDGFRGCKAAILDGGPIMIVGGRSRSGKTSLCEAAGAVLSGEWDINRSIAGGIATAAFGADAATMSWPDATFTATEDWKPCSRIAAGASAWATDFNMHIILNVAPDEATCIMAFTAAGLADPLAAKLWKSIETRGWEDVHKSLRGHGKNLVDPAAIETNRRLCDLIGFRGLRFNALGPALESFNSRMADIAKPWPAVKADHDGRLWIGGRDMDDASDAERIMARAVFQTAVAQIDGSPMIVLDLGGWFDLDLRSDLVEMLAREKMAALIAYTCNRARRVPNVPADIGTAYWMEDGLARPRSECAS